MKVAVIILAAGKASRMGAGGPHKLLAEFDGIPLVRRSSITACKSKADAAIVVVGHRHLEIMAVLDGLDLHRIHNPDYASGMAGSLITGLLCDAASRADGILIFHADIPGISAEDLDRLIAAFKDAGGKAVVRAVSQGRRGNPVILPRALYDGVRRLEGDVGARHLIETSGLPIINVEISDSAFFDVDTQEAVIAAGGVLKA